MSRRMALFISHYSIDNSPSILNVIDQFARKAQVTLFVRRVRHRESPALFQENVKIVDLDRYLDLVRQACFEWLRYLFGAPFDAAIAFDPHGMVLSKVLMPHLCPFYYSLELYLHDDHYGLYYPQWVARLERGRINKIRGLIIQSREKEEIFRRDYYLSPEIPTFILPVAYRGGSSPEKSDFLRRRLGIAPQVKILLHLGGIAAWFSCLELAKAVAGMKEWALVFHGYGSSDYIVELETFIQNYNIDNVFIHKEQFRELGMVDEVVKSGDVGIAWYNDVSAGFRTAGRSSGKISAYLRFGLPVVAKRYPSTHEAIEAAGAGLCVDDFSEIPGILDRLSNEYPIFSARARETYDKDYNFENYAQSLEQFIWSPEL